MRMAGTSLPYRHSRAASHREKLKNEAKKNITEAIELHLITIARDGLPFYHRPGVKEAFVSVDI